MYFTTPYYIILPDEMITKGSGSKLPIIMPQSVLKSYYKTGIDTGWHRLDLGLDVLCTHISTDVIYM